MTVSYTHLDVYKRQVKTTTVSELISGMERIHMPKEVTIPLTVMFLSLIHIYDNQRYGFQDNFMIKYPKLIKTATEKLANVREDVKARDKELIDNPEFAITIGKATYTAVSYTHLDVYKRQSNRCL